MKGFLSRFPFTILGTLGIIGLASNFIVFEKHMQDWITVWQSFTAMLWGWFPFDIQWLRDYLTAGLIASGMIIRVVITSTIYHFKEQKRKYDLEFREILKLNLEGGLGNFFKNIVIFTILLWPFILFMMFIPLLFPKMVEEDELSLRGRHARAMQPLSNYITKK